MLDRNPHFCHFFKKKQLTPSVTGGPAARYCGDSGPTDRLQQLYHHSQHSATLQHTAVLASYTVTLNPFYTIRAPVFIKDRQT